MNGGRFIQLDSNAGNALPDAAVAQRGQVRVLETDGVDPDTLWYARDDGTGSIEWSPLSDQTGGGGGGGDATELIDPTHELVGIEAKAQSASSENHLVAQTQDFGWPGLLTVDGPGSNIHLHLLSKGTGTVYINWDIPLLETAPQAITNKTIDAASNTLSNIPTSAISNYQASVLARQSMRV